MKKNYEEKKKLKKHYRNWNMYKRIQLNICMLIKFLFDL